MADQTLVARLPEILRRHAMWRRGENGERADLSGADLSGANLANTVFDPARPCSGAGPEFGRLRSGRVVGYRTQTSTHVGTETYEPGRAYRAPWFSVCTTECRPGLYLWPTLEQAREWAQGAAVVRVSARAEDVHRAGAKHRARAFRVLNVVTDND